MYIMKVITTTKARANLSQIINEVCYGNTPIGIGRRNKIEAIIIKCPDPVHTRASEITSLNAYGSSFDFLQDEPDLYSKNDLKKSEL